MARPGTNVPHEFYTMLARHGRDRAELDRSILTVGNLFDVVPLPPAEPGPVDFEDLVGGSQLLRDFRSNAGDLVQGQAGRMTLVSAVRGLDHYGMSFDRFQEHASTNGTDVSLTYCLMTENWHELGAFLTFADGRDLPVYVNTVTSPARLSLYHLRPQALARIVTSMEEENAAMQSILGRNRSVWDDQFVRLRRALDSPINDGEVPVHFPAFSHPPRRSGCEMEKRRSLV